MCFIFNDETIQNVSAAKTIFSKKMCPPLGVRRFAAGVEDGCAIQGAAGLTVSVYQCFDFFGFVSLYIQFMEIYFYICL